MTPSDLDRRVRMLERQLVLSRWRERLVMAAALVAGIVFACKGESSSKADHQEQGPIKLGRVTIDGNGIKVSGAAGTSISIDGDDIRLATDTKSATLKPGGLDITGKDANIIFEAGLHGPTLLMSGTDKHQASLSVASDQTSLSLINDKGTVFTTATSTTAGVDVKLDPMVAALIVSSENKDASVSAMAGKRSVSLRAASDKAEVHYEK
jgi:hypothetical protein